MTLRPTTTLPVLTALAVAAFGATPAEASEGGASFYLLGSGGPGAAILPPIRGVFFDNTFYYYDGKAEAQRQFDVGGNLVAGIEARIAADFATVLWVPSTDVLGGTLAVGAALPVGQPDVDVGLVITGPGGAQVTVARTDEAFLVGDPVLNAELSWNVAKNLHVAAATMVNVPVGQYREGQLANLAFHRWIVDASVAVTWHDPKAGWDISGKAGLTFNGTNRFTNYNTGTEFHVEASIEHMFSPAFSAGLQAYHFDQVTGDSGEGAVLGAFKGRVTGIGATAAYNFRIGHTPISARVRFFEEFNAERRLDGKAFLFSLTLPLHVEMPAGAAP